MPSYAPGDYVKVEFPDEATGVGSGCGCALRSATTRRR